MLVADQGEAAERSEPEHVQAQEGSRTSSSDTKTVKEQRSTQLSDTTRKAVQLDATISQRVATMGSNLVRLVAQDAVNQHHRHQYHFLFIIRDTSACLRL
jgi:hypothetical protein